MKKIEKKKENINKSNKRKDSNQVINNGDIYCDKVKVLMT